MERYAAVGVLVLLGVTMLVFLWQTADTLAVRFGDHCQNESEPFVRVHEKDAIDEPTWDVIAAPGDEGDCAVQTSHNIWTATSTALTLKGTEIAVEQGSATADWRLATTTAEWVEAPGFVSSLGTGVPMLFYFEAGPRLLYGAMLFAAVAAVVARHWFYGKD